MKKYFLSIFLLFISLFGLSSFFLINHYGLGKISYYIADCCYQTKKHDVAQIYANWSLERTTDLQELSLVENLIGKIFLARGFSGEAKSFFEKGRAHAQELSIPWGRNSYNLGLAFIREKEYHEAQKYLYDAHEAGFGDDESLFFYSSEKLVELYQDELTSEQVEEELSFWHKELRDKGYTHGVQLAVEELMFFYEKKQDYKRAIEYAELLDSPPPFVLENLYELAKEWEKLEALYVDKEDTDDLLYLGLSQMNLGKFDEAEKTYKRALASASNEWGVLDQVAFFYQKKGEPKEALKYAEEALERLKSSPSTSIQSYYDLYYTFGCIYAQDGQLERAEEFLNKSIELGQVLNSNSLDKRYLAISELSK